nr:immunoglobulin light chain junction region [Macaca mulatta]
CQQHGNRPRLTF